MYRLLTLIVCLGALVALSPASMAAHTVVADYTFDDASSLAPFTIFGDPSVAGGQLVLDGDDWLEIADPLGGATDNYVIEAIFNADAFGPGPPVFDFVFARNDPAGAFGGNNGQGALIQDFGSGPGQIKVLNSNSGATGGFVADPDPFNVTFGASIAVAAVQNGGVTEIYVNGVQLANPASSDAIVGVPTNLGIGTHPFDGALGAFNGTIDRVRLSTFNQGGFMASELLIVPEPVSIAMAMSAVGLLATSMRRRVTEV